MTGTSIKRKIMRLVMLTSVTVLLLTVAAFTTYDLVTYRDTITRNVSTIARMTADTSSAALAFRNEKDAQEVLSSLVAEPQINSAALYDTEGKLFVVYPASANTNIFPRSVRNPGYHFGANRLVAFEPVYEDNVRMGTLYLSADLRAFYRRVKIYALISGLIVTGSIIVVLLLSNRLQKGISEPILALADTAQTISRRRDYAVRAEKLSDDELGLLTDAFNQMLTRIQEQTVALEESSTRLNLALEASGTGTWDWNMTTNLVTWDEYNASLFGIKSGEFKGTYEHFLSLIHAGDREKLGAALTAAISKKKDFSYEFRVTWPDGTIHDIATRGRAFYDVSGKAVRMSGVSQDITERRRSEEASRRLAAIVESSDDAILSKDLDGIIMSWNRGAENLLGHTASEVIGRSILVIVPEDRQTEEADIIARIRSGDRIEHYETVRRHKSGNMLIVSITVSPIRNADGRIIGASTIARDITEQKQAHAALERQAQVLREQAQMLDLANVMARDMDDRVVLWNTGMEEMYGWLRTEVLGRRSHDILKTEFPRPFEELKSILLRDEQWEGELIHTRKDGQRITVNSQWVLHKDPAGNPSAILEINTDITERKRAELQILRMNIDLEQRVRERTSELTQANQELEAFTYSVAHDLRAPLRHIDAFTKIIFDDFAPDIPEEARRYLESIRKGSQNMSRLVDDLLNLARVGRQELKRERISLNPVVREVIGDLKRETETRQVEWLINPLPHVESDPGLMKQVFANLLSNAVKYTRPRQKAVIEVGQRKINGETAIYVHDNGVGFSMKYADKLFGVFQRLHRSDEFEGTGVGLATVERIVRKHGGRIWAEAELEKGATFYFTLDGLGKGPPPPGDELPSINGNN